MGLDQSSTSEDDRAWVPSWRSSKRVRTNTSRALRTATGTAKAASTSSISLASLLEIPLLSKDFEDIFHKDDYLAARHKLLCDGSETDLYNNKLRQLTLSELHNLRAWFRTTAAAGRQNWTAGEAILARKLELRKLKKYENATFSYDALWQPHDRHCQTLRLPSPPPLHSAPNEETLAALYSIHKTPYLCSFASRLLGSYGTCEGRHHWMHRDWETQAPWMNLMSDIRLHHSLLHPDDDSPAEVIAPIDYLSPQEVHLPQIHALLAQIFWSGINVSDSLRYSPNRCAIVASYKWLVVGAAFLSSPEETYLTYLVVRPGWENANIASVMLYHLITMNPGRDITLHVSANSPAMLLYNKFGFKAEEFIVGFYEDYLSKDSKACKNAFRLRLRG